MKKYIPLIIATILICTCLVGVSLQKSMPSHNNTTVTDVNVNKTNVDNKSFDEIESPNAAEANNNVDGQSQNEIVEPIIEVDEQGNQMIKPNYQKPTYADDVLVNKNVKPSDIKK